MDMFRKLFSRSKVNATEPHPLKVNFAHHTIPTLLGDENRASFLSVLISDGANDYLKKTWLQVGEQALAKKDLISPDDMEVSIFKKEGYFYTFFHFPAPSMNGEPHFGLAVFFPPEGGDWNAESVKGSDYAYFTALAHDTTISTWMLEDGIMTQTGIELELNKHKFVEWVQEQITS